MPQAPKKERDLSLVKYAVILLVVAILVIVTLGLFGPAIDRVYSEMVGTGEASK